MTKIMVQFDAPIYVEVDVEDMNEETILNAVWADLRNPDSTTTFAADYDNLKEVLRASSVEEIDGDVVTLSY